MSVIPARICLTLSVVDRHVGVLCSSVQIVIEHIPDNGKAISDFQALIFPS
jgi:hypothetical protein